MIKDYIVKQLVLFRYTIRTSVTVRGDEWDGYNKVLITKFLSKSFVKGEDLTVYFIYMPDFLVINTSYIIKTYCMLFCGCL